MTIDRLLEDLKVKVPELEIRILKLEAAVEGLFKLLSDMTIRDKTVNGIISKIIEKHNVLSSMVGELKEKLKKEDEDDNKT